MALGKNFWNLIAVKSLNGIPETFLGTFMISYIMRVYNNAIIPIAVYNIFYYLFMFIVFIGACYLLSRVRITNIYRWGIGIAMILLGTIALFGETSLNYIWIIGGIYGLAFGLTKLGLDYMQTSMISNQLKFSAYRTAGDGIIKVGFPALCGFLLGQSSFPQMSGVIFLICGGILALTFGIRDTNTAHRCCNKFDIQAFYKTSSVSKYKRPIIYAMLGEFLYGCSKVIDIVQTMLIIYLFKTDLSLGLINSGLMATLILFRLGFGRFGSQKYFNTIFIAALGAIGIGTIFLINLTEFNFLAFCFCYTLGSALAKLVYEPVFFTLVRTIPGYEKEFLAVREFWLNMGRITMCGGLGVIVYLTNIVLGLQIYAILMGAIYFMATLIAMAVNKRVRVS